MTTLQCESSKKTFNESLWRMFELHDVDLQLFELYNKREMYPISRGTLNKLNRANDFREDRAYSDKLSRVNCNKQSFKRVRLQYNLT